MKRLALSTLTGMLLGLGCTAVGMAIGNLLAAAVMTGVRTEVLRLKVDSLEMENRALLTQLGRVQRLLVDDMNMPVVGTGVRDGAHDGVRGTVDLADEDLIPPTRVPTN